MNLSIIVPSYNESKNIAELTKRIRMALSDAQLTYELWFIDDSNDDSPFILQQLATQYPEVHFYHREEARGLGSAVIEGFARSTGMHVIVMDADLQHPPELLPNILSQLQAGADIVIPSRFIPGGSDGGLNWFRKLVSLVARKIGQLAIKRFRRVSDCTSGYFGFKRSVIEGANLTCSSWKILMEVLMKGNYTSIKEVPYHFTARDAGESKMSFREQFNYLWHIANLVWSSPADRRFYLFCFVGFLGLIVNLLIFDFLLQRQMFPAAASIIASLVGMLHNYIWHDLVTWKVNHSSFWQRLVKFPQFVLVSLIGIAIVAVIVKLFVTLQFSPMLGQIIGIAIAIFWNFFANHLWTWRVKTT